MAEGWWKGEEVGWPSWGCGWRRSERRERAGEEREREERRDATTRFARVGGEDGGSARRPSLLLLPPLASLYASFDSSYLPFEVSFESSVDLLNAYVSLPLSLSPSKQKVVTSINSSFSIPSHPTNQNSAKTNERTPLSSLLPMPLLLLQLQLLLDRQLLQLLNILHRELIGHHILLRFSLRSRRIQTKASARLPPSLLRKLKKGKRGDLTLATATKG